MAGAPKVVGFVEIGRFLPGSESFGLSALRLGDVILQVGALGSSDAIVAPFPGGLLEVVNAFQQRLARGEEEVEVIIGRYGRNLEFFLPLAGLKSQKSKKYPGHLLNCKLEEGTAERFAAIADFEFQRLTAVARSNLSRASINRVEVPEVVTPPSSLFSVLVHPVTETDLSSNPGLRNTNHTGARAMNWVSRMHASGVAINVVSMATEVIPVHRHLFGSGKVKEYQHSWDIGQESAFECVRCVRLWLMPQKMVRFSLQPTNRDANSWGISLMTTLEGFIIIDDVFPNGEAALGGLTEVYRSATLHGGKLVIASVDGTSTLPTTLTGTIEIASKDDIVKIMRLHLEALTPITFNFIVSDEIASAPPGGPIDTTPSAPPGVPVDTTPIIQGPLSGDLTLGALSFRQRGP